MSVNDLLIQARAENAQLRVSNTELEQQAEILLQQPEFDLSRVHVREQAVLANLKKTFEEGAV
ncbi:hypothetical protein L1D40_19625 [Shewanella insulae]|uniref:hypothetical protein n=1 Tax=Shewanella insulae TaxID=2681496 RepID=UPI001EFDA162|nr:hypothetical protein [Shewanella insulae]MCG9714852.1 hypothetical protein [Shewanella insulae]MCG9757395.1 hypothetical protein [Shewanella insulae]